MVQVFLLLLGGRLIRRRWWVLGSLGLLWMLLGTFFFADAFIEEIRIPVPYFAAPLLVDGILSLIAAALFVHNRPLRIGRAAVFLAVALLLVWQPRHAAFLVAMVVGTFLTADGFWRAGSAVVVRFPGWPGSLVKGLFELALGIWSYLPWPTNYRADVGSDVGLLLMVSAAGMLGLALRLRHMPPETSLSAILSTGWPDMPAAAEVLAGPEEAESRAARPRETATVHVWTPTGQLAPLRSGVRRYIAATDETGHVSTGHSALDLPPDLYISHYPAVEIEHAPGEFARLLRATQENDVPGRFQPSYAEESAGWCPSSFQVEMPGLDAAAIRDFWALYRQDETYNLTNRNCSSAVVKALDAGMEGLFEQAARSPLFILRLLASPELWVAGMVRHRASTMAWTPGLVLDYVRALRRLILDAHVARG
ncbi:HdeD family acid-resistance protein [Aquabacter spiritensis]|uniref:Uncharacterized membrane protein HdeD (DUF308 family) n=1 Tax=Aquabacter spiritensis TaxID=933073 RepID=A0A4R3M833_9HYPH|nr:protease [Aquabacter spiritensis]TCT07797.1 uncharacterized membrane protein HdeD (DUF308 family) [Aquabacter spiritensis]